MSYVQQGAAPEAEKRPPPTTTVEQDTNTASQRRINLIWEITQAAVALLVVLACMIVGVYQGLAGDEAGEFPTILSSALFLVIGFYFSRTNHQSIGGIGPKPTQPYQGR